MHNLSSERKFEAKKSLGQNFLRDPRVIEKIIEAAELPPDALVVEVGPGFGILTAALLQKARRVRAIEKDTRLLQGLKEKFATALNAVPGSPSLELIHGDALTVAPPAEPYFLVANIPYSITSPLLDHFIREQPHNLPQRAVVLVQKEVAHKMCARPPDMNVLALHIQTFGRPRIIAPVSKHVFTPKPKVDSAIVRIDFPVNAFQANPSNSKPLATSEPFVTRNFDQYFKLIHTAFSHKRKMLRATLPPELLAKAGIDPTRRPETLTLKEWSDLAHGLALSRHP